MENHFQSRDGAQWVIEAAPIPTGGTMLRYRLSECEAGFRLIRGQASSYTRDKCEMLLNGLFVSRNGWSCGI